MQVSCFRGNARFEPRTLGYHAERFAHLATRPVEGEFYDYLVTIAPKQLEPQVFK
jgi:hypothetical protein